MPAARPRTGCPGWSRSRPGRGSARTTRPSAFPRGGRPPARAPRPSRRGRRRRPTGERGSETPPFQIALEAATDIVSALVGDPVDRPRIVIQHQERAVPHLLHVHRPAPDLVTLEPALGEHLVLRHVSGAESHHHDPEAELLGAVPGAALGEERAVLVLRRKHRARVEVDTVAGDVRDRKSTRLNSSHGYISYAVFCLK